MCNVLDLEGRPVSNSLLLDSALSPSDSTTSSFEPTVSVLFSLDINLSLDAESVLGEILLLITLIEFDNFLLKAFRLDYAFSFYNFSCFFWSSNRRLFLRI